MKPGEHDDHRSDDLAADSLVGDAGDDWFFADTATSLPRDNLARPLLIELLDEI